MRTDVRKGANIKLGRKGVNIRIDKGCEFKKKGVRLYQLPKSGKKCSSPFDQVRSRAFLRLH